MQISESQKKLAFHGRGKVARSLDHVLFLLFVFVSFWLLARKRSHAVLLASLLTFLSGIAYAVWLHVYVKRSIEHRKKQLEKELKKDKLLLMDGERMEATLGKAHRVVRKRHAMLDDVLPFLKTDVKELWFCGTAEDGISDFVRIHFPSVKLHFSEELILRLGISVTQAECEQAERIKRQLPKRERTLKSVLRETNPNRFLLLGAILLALSFFSPYVLYFRLLSSGAFLMGSLRFLKTKKQWKR